MSFTVDDFHDLLRLLQERPEWRAEVRRVVLTDDLLRLPEDLARARLETERSFQELAQRLDTLTQRIDTLTTQVGTLAGHVGVLRGVSLERRYRTRVFSYFGRLVRSAHALTADELTSMLEAAIAAGTLSVETAHEVALADLIVRGRRPTDGATVHLVVEVSVGVGVSDVQRARDRAALLARVGVTTLPVVAGEWVTPDAADAARGLRVWQLTDAHVVAPD